MNNIRECLCREARRISDASVREMPETAEEWYAQRPRRWQQYMEMMGMPSVPSKEERPPLNVRTVRLLDRSSAGYRIEVLCFESIPGLYVTANLYLPVSGKSPYPAVIYLNGHSYTQKTASQYHCQHLAKLGFVTLVLDTIEYWEMFGTHHGPYSHGQYQWLSRGYTPAGVEMWNAVRGVDLLQSRSEVDPDRIGAMGNSGGGAITWFLGAADERVGAVAPNCGTATLSTQIIDRTVDDHCDCMLWINTYRWDLPDIGALIAPRALLISVAEGDYLYSTDSMKECFQRIRAVYELLGREDRVALIETPGPHGYHEVSRKATYAWFMRHLRGEDVDPHLVPDLVEDPLLLEKHEDLLVFPDRVLPPNERTTTAHDIFVPRASAPAIESPSDLVAHREALLQNLRPRTFGHFPDPPCHLEVTTDFEWETASHRFARLGFTPEEGWRLPAILAAPKEGAAGEHRLLVHLVGSRDSISRDTRPYLRHLVPAGLSDLGADWSWLAVAVRGVDETSWGDGLAWHVRRASAAIGRTVASMRVYDALRALEMARSLDSVRADRIAISGAGDMSVVALYTALLDGTLSAVVLADPPATQDAPGHPNGIGDCTEMLSVLRYTDLPYVAGLLWPTRIVFLEPYEFHRVNTARPTSYLWTEDLYARLGPPGAVSHIQEWSALRI
ncbi:MAG: hypothetical protein HPY83_02955 [Anaerolineae bacterium]|nr:hypothetical protein [Anaerolineae bacterium]